MPKGDHREKGTSEPTTVSTTGTTLGNEGNLFHIDMRLLLFEIPSINDEFYRGVVGASSESPVGAVSKNVDPQLGSPGPPVTVTNLIKSDASNNNNNNNTGYLSADVKEETNGATAATMLGSWGHILYFNLFLLFL